MNLLNQRSWYCTMILIITTVFYASANQDSYTLTSGGQEKSSLDVAIESLEKSAARALKSQDITQTEEEEVPQEDPTEKGWFRRQADWLFGPSTKKTVRKMNFAELEEFKNRCLERKDTYNAIKTLERMVPLCTDLEKLKYILIELADLLFDDGKLESSFKMYREFVRYYPGNEKVEYAQYKAILCKFYLMNDAERDQSNTRDTIEFANKFLEREDIFTTYSKEVRTIRSHCHQRLFESEVNVFEFYCNRGRYKSAQTRLANIRKDFMAITPAVEPYILTLEMNLAKEMNNATIADEKQKELNERFPTYTHTALTKLEKPDLPKKSNIDRF